MVNINPDPRVSSTVTVNPSSPILRCPACGYDATTYEGLIVSIEPYSGTYCLRCFAAWVKGHIPKMEAIEREPAL